MVRQMATTALLLVHFSDSPRLGGCGCGGVECFVPLGVLGVEWSWYQVGRTVAGPAPMACVACGRRGGQAGCVWLSFRL